MADREKVIKGLEMCKIMYCDECPYDDEENCSFYLNHDALELLKEQETDKKDAEYMPMEVIPVTIGNDYRTWLCSACGTKLHYGNEPICPKCHRKIDWNGR